MWDGLYLPSIKESINRSHKQIVQWAMDNDLPEVIIAEDDIHFYSNKSWEYFLSKKPNWWEYDMFLSMIFLGDITPENKVRDFTGMTMYAISQKFYDIFLSTPNDEHIDRSLVGLGDFHVCIPFVATQHNGISSNTGKHESYESLLENRPRLNL
jgi:GR25 family glycosyltransferase involved in LPS biosynthesis